MLRADFIDQALTVIGPNDFIMTSHANLFAALVTLRARGQPTDPVSAADQLRADGLLDNWANPAHLTSLQNKSSGASVALGHARIVADKARARRLIAAGQEVVEAGYSGRVDDGMARLHSFTADLANLVEPTRPIDWSAFWERDRAPEDWVLAPIIARGRSHAVYAGGKTGKSLVVLWLAAMAAVGRPVLHQPAGEPIDVVYIDLEMTEDDLQDRLEDMGFGPADDLSHLHYYLLPSLPPMDTAAGGKALIDIARCHGAQLAVIDTLARAVEGDENDSNTIRAFYRNAGMALKAAGIATVRLDHAGKDVERGQRGTSAKNDDVDVVYQLTAMEHGYRLKATHRRMRWIPDSVDLAMTQEPLTFATAAKLWPAGVPQLVKFLDTWEVPLDLSRRKVRDVLRAHGETASDTTLGAAIAWRKRDADRTEGRLWEETK